MSPNPSSIRSTASRRIASDSFSRIGGEERFMRGSSMKVRKQKSPVRIRGSFAGAEEPSGLFRLDRHGRLVVGAVLGVLDVARLHREQRVVLARADVLPGVELGAALAHDDRARVDELAAEGLQAQALAFGIA